MVDERTRQIISMRMDGSSLQQIADALGVSRQYIDQEIKNFANPRGRNTPINCIYPNLSEQMRISKITKSDLACAADVSNETVGYWLSGKHDIPFSQAVKLKQFIKTDMPLDKLFEIGDVES